MFWRKNANNDDTSTDKKNTGRMVDSPKSPPTFALPRGAVADHSPTIVNGTEYPIVVFLERGTLYNTQVLHPGEAVCMTRRQTGGVGVLPYRVHAMIGDEASLPRKSDSLKNLVKSSVIPAAFVAGCLASAMSAGTLAGPSAALAPMVSGMVVKGVVIDAAALAAGSVMASRAKIVTELLLRKQKDKFMVMSSQFMPGQRYLKVTGGLSEGPLTINEMEKGKAKGMQVTAIKSPMALRDDNDKGHQPNKEKKQHDQNDIQLLKEDSSLTNTADQREETVDVSVPLSMEDHRDTISQQSAMGITATTQKVSKSTWSWGKPKSSAPIEAQNDLIAATVL
ncbi:hypothetical protein IV203_033220 [Nitzschia inconspicua]|uniref:Uncharacterized protein n=1 Tax=Nitzschia inconspicua TaxID=303405 RepID=A0A9K3PI11_9STRA|nr:hypothetical protein IV203_033220 [Nitzschia inconspicua]